MPEVTQLGGGKQQTLVLMLRAAVSLEVIPGPPGKRSEEPSGPPLRPSQSSSSFICRAYWASTKIEELILWLQWV